MATMSATTALSAEWIEDFAKRWVAGWNAHDADALAGICHPEIVWTEPAPRRVLQGREEVRQWIAKNLEAFPDLQIEVVQEFPVPAEARAAAWWRLRGTHRGPLEPPGFAPTGRGVTIEGVDFWEFRDGLLARMRMIYDVSDLAVQLGLAPKPGGALERAMVAMQRRTANLRR